MNVRITRFQPQTIADCEGCLDLSVDATRVQVRAHVRETGHVARVIVEAVTKYEPDTKARPA